MKRVEERGIKALIRVRQKNAQSHLADLAKCIDFRLHFLRKLIPSDLEKKIIKCKKSYVKTKDVDSMAELARIISSKGVESMESELDKFLKSRRKKWRLPWHRD